METDAEPNAKGAEGAVWRKEGRKSRVCSFHLQKRKRVIFYCLKKKKKDERIVSL